MPTLTHALTEQHQAGFWLFGPEIFRTYCRRHGLRANTAATMSVDHARNLSKELRDAHTMVLRLGTGHGDDNARGQDRLCPGPARKPVARSPAPPDGTAPGAQQHP